jgi:hypothetical protein
MRAKVCFFIVSGGGFIPRIMTQARIDLYNQFHKTSASIAFTHTSNLNIVILTIPLNYE